MTKNAFKKISWHLRQRRKNKLLIDIAGWEERFLHASYLDIPRLSEKIGRAKRKLEILITKDSGKLTKNKAKIYRIK